VRYRSQIIFRIGGYCPPYSDPISDGPYSGYSPWTFSVSPTGLSPFLAVLSSTLRVTELGPTRVQTPHSCSLSRQVRFVLFPFRSPLLRESQLVSFPAGNEMFQFPASPFPSGNVRRHVVTFRNPGFEGCMRLPRAYRSLPRPSSVSEPSRPPYSVTVLYLSQELAYELSSKEPWLA
jgi:hypothetical protein